MVAQASLVKHPSRIFSVVVIGANTNDVEIIERIFGITRYRPRSYQLHAVTDLTSKAQWSKAHNADIYIVNVNDAKAVVSWHRFSTNTMKGKINPVLQLSKKTTVSEAVSEFVIPYPINPSKLLQALDNYTIRHLHYYPEYQIGTEVEPNSAAVHNIKAIATSAQKAKEPSKSHPVRVLVADDSTAVRRQLKIEFDTMNAQLDSVADGEAALKAVEEEKYDVIFLDVVMPGMDGYTVCKNIRKSRLNKTTPVVMLTSRSSKFDKLKGILAGCDTYLTKPVNHNEFKQITQKHLSKNMEKIK